MGLSLCYELRFKGERAAAQAAIEHLHSVAITQSFDEVGTIIEGSAEDPEGSDDPGWQMLGVQYGKKTLPDGREAWIDIPPQQVIAFGIQPAEGAETAHFGLATHPACIEYPYDGGTMLIETGLAGTWSWSQCCKTQYAGLKQFGGEENFLRAHLGLIAVLDAAVELGLQVQVSDDSGYWEDRNEDELRKQLKSWNGLVAAFAGQLKDRVDPEAPNSISAPILSAPDFEHLEADGIKEWSETEDDEEDPQT